jgi:diguanylate cyclase (GGDEF)-like protein
MSRFRAPTVRFVGTVGARPLRVLFLHQDAATVEQCLRELRTVQVAVVGDVAHTPEQLAGRLDSEAYDLILAEYPGGIGLAAEARQRLQGLKQTPLIFLVNGIERDTAAELVSNGAAGCVDMEHLSHLPVAIRRALNGRNLATERDRAERQWRHSEAPQHGPESATDPLTGLANYRELARVLDAEIKRSGRTGREFAVIVFEVARPKEINDKRGDEIGREALRRVADCLSIFSRQIDTVARLGGDEFALMLPETGEASAPLVANRILQHLARDRQAPRMSVSVGIAVYPRDGGRIDVLLSVARDAMAAMKGRMSGLMRSPAGRLSPGSPHP